MPCFRVFRRLALIASACSLVIACDGKSRNEVTGVQSFCVEPVDGPDGPALEVSVQVAACLSSSCDTLIESDCSYTEVDGVLQLDASALIESEGDSCTADCQSVSATCTIPVEAGRTYLVRGGDGDELEIDVDSEVHEPVCSPDSL